MLRCTLEILYCEFWEALKNMNKLQKDGNIDRDFQLKRKEQSLELEIQEAFLRFMVLILKGYRSFLLPIIKAPTVGATDTNSLFNLQMFLRSRDKSHQKFYSLLTKTQMFIRFIEERSFVSDLDAGLAFFDECIEKVEQEDNDYIRLLELDSHQSDRTVFISPPEQNGPPHAVNASNYSYQNGFTLNPVLFAHKGPVKNFIDSYSMNAIPGSPMARRSKYEVKSAQKLARKYFCSPELWSKCLLGTCYSLWFIHLPSFVLFTEHKVSSTLRLAYELLVRIQKTGFHPTDEVCYRVMMQLCGVYNLPMLAVKLLILMKRSGTQPNAITYGFYNRAVLESKWPSDMRNPSQLLWNKLRNVIHAAALFRQIGQQAGIRRLSAVDEVSLVDGSSARFSTENSYEHVKHINVAFGSGSQSDIGYKSASEGLIDNQENSQTGTLTSVLETSSTDDVLSDDTINDLISMKDFEFYLDTYGGKMRRASAITSRDIATFDKFCSRMGSIVKSSGMQLRVPSISVNQQPFESSAGLLMTGGGNVIGFPENDQKNFSSEKNSSTSTCSPKIRPNSRIIRRNRSGSCTEITLSCSPRNGRRHHNYYSPQATHASKPQSIDSSDCYHLLTRSESFANDAQILQNLQEIKQQRNAVIHETKSNAMRLVGSNIMNKSMFGRRASLHKLKEYPKSESRTSSIETLPSSGTESMDDILAACSNATKRINNKVLTALSNRFNKVNENHLRKHSVSSLDDNKEQSTESLTRVSSSPLLKSPVRTPVTENDPLGALSNEKHEMTDGVKTLPNLDVFTSTSEIVLDKSGAPVLFDRRRKKWSSVRKANFHHSAGSGIDQEIEIGDDEVNLSRIRKESDNRKQKQRSLPTDVRDSTNHGSPFKTGLGNLSNFKLPFSPTSLTSKKSNEIIMGGLSSLKNAASSMAKKIDEFKEAMSSNSTPLKDGVLDNHYEDEPNEYMTVNTSLINEETPVKRKISSEFSPSSVTQQLDSWGANLMELFSDGSRKGSSSNLQPLGEHSSSSSQQSLALLSERLYPKTMRDSRVPVALELIMTTCSKCHHCSSLIYDEEIMSAWLPEDSNLNTKCPYCDRATVPFLYVNILDYRSSNEMPKFTSQESMSSIDKIRRKSSVSKLCASTNSIDGSRISVDSVAVEEELKLKNVVTLEPTIVPYLNPLVLRKELESILNAEGDNCLTRSSFVDEHPIIYWNMVWGFERIAVTSHVTGLCLNSGCVLGKRDITSFHASWLDCDHTNVLVRTLWDNPQLHEEVGFPMYVLWNKNDKQSDLLSALLTDSTTVPRSLMERVISCIQCNDLEEPIRRVAAERSKLKSHGINHNFSLYRDILFLSFVALGRENIDQSAFDKEYMIALENLSPADRDSKIYMRCDNPNLNTSVYCRHYFKELDL